MSPEHRNSLQLASHARLQSCTKSQRSGQEAANVVVYSPTPAAKRGAEQRPRGHWRNDSREPDHPTDSLVSGGRGNRTASLPFDLIDSYACLGVHPKIVSEMLGHATVAITLDLYSHVTPTMQRQAADSLDAVLAHR